MQTACPNCPHEAIGTETASVCVECGNAAVAGASLNLPMLLVTAVVVAAVCVVASRLWHGRWLPSRRLATA